MASMAREYRFKEGSQGSIIQKGGTQESALSETAAQHGNVVISKASKHLTSLQHIYIIAPTVRDVESSTVTVVCHIPAGSLSTSPSARVISINS